MLIRILIIVSVVIKAGTFLIAQNQSPDTTFLPDLLNENDSLFSKILSDTKKYEVQIIYTQINRDKKNQPSFKTFHYRVDPKEYFYPASTVKLPAVLLSLEKINQLNVGGLTKETSLRIDSACCRLVPVIKDSTSGNGNASIAHYIKKVFLVSDNDAYNRLFEFVGQAQMNEGLYKKGFKDLRIIKRLSVGSKAEEDKYSNPFTFYSQEGKIIYHQPLLYNPKEYPNKLSTTKRGKGYMENDTLLVEEPLDFSPYNYIAIQELHNILKSLIFPDSFPEQQRFLLKEEDYKFLYKYMSMFPCESTFPEYDSSYYDSYGKFFLFGNSKKNLPPDIRIFNKAGWAYGYLTDNAYIVDFKNKVEFLITATIQVNEDGIYNDDRYEYDTIGLPFFADLGQVIYKYELKRKRKYLPDLERFKFDYKKSR